MPNLTDLVQRGLPVGNYTGTITEVVRTVSKNSQSPQLEVSIEADSGKTQKFWRTLLPDYLGFAAADLMAVGEELEFGDAPRSEWPEILADYYEQTMTDREVRFTVTKRTGKKAKEGQTDVTILGNASDTPSPDLAAAQADEDVPF